MLSKKAIAIVNMLIFVFIFTILSGIILVLVSSQARDLEASIRRTKAFYVAEAGSVAALENIRKISAFDRWGIQNDLYAFARSGKIGFEDYLAFIESYKDEQDDLVCRDVSAHLHRAYTLLDGELKEKTFRIEAEK